MRCNIQKLQREYYYFGKGTKNCFLYVIQYTMNLMVTHIMVDLALVDTYHHQKYIIKFYIVPSLGRQFNFF